MKTASTHASPKRPRADSGERMPVKNRNGLPAYQRIQGAIRKRIDAGHLHPGDAVASERDLAKIHQVSLMTARHAAKVLDNENEAAARLSLPPTSKIIKLERLRHAAGEAFALETCYLSAAEFSGLLDAPIGRESLFGILERNYNIELGYADEEIDATAADPRTAEILSIPRREPLLRIRQVIYSTKGKAIMYVLGFYRSDRHNLVIRRFR